MIFPINLQLVSRSCSYGTFDGRTIEKEFITRQLQDGIIEKVTLLKDGNQQCINTVTENLQTGHKTSVQQLINLDESNKINLIKNKKCVRTT